MSRAAHLATLIATLWACGCASVHTTCKDTPAGAVLFSEYTGGCAQNPSTVFVAGISCAQVITNNYRDRK